MNEAELIREIVREYAAEDNFLVQLRAQVEFDEDRYHQTVDLIEQYIRFAKGRDLVSRPVMLFLFDLIVLLEGQIGQLQQFNHPLTNKTIKAREQFIKLRKNF